MTGDSMSFSDPELQLLVNLLQQERDELPSEIRRTDRIEVHDKLQERLKVVDGLIEKFSHTPLH